MKYPARQFDFRLRNVALDVLRGTAILLVLFNHANSRLIPGFEGFGEGPDAWLFWRVKMLGWSGVDLFFVLSGFLIGGMLIQEVEKFNGGIKLSRFYVRRAFKILPSFFFLIFVLWATGALLLDWAQWLSFPTFTQNYVLEATAGPTWSLSVEEHFYLLFPLALIIAARVGSRASSRHAIPVLVLTVIGLCSALRALNVWSGISDDDFMLSHFRVDSIVTGVGCYYLWSRYPGWIDYMANHRRWVFLLLVVALLMQTMWFSRTDGWMFSVGFTSLSVAYGVLLLIVVETRLFGMSGSALSRAVAFVGRNSYNIYLWHYFFILIPVPGYAALQYAVLRNFEGNIASLIQLIVLIVYAIIVGVVATQLVEKPFLNLRRRMCA